VRGWGVVFFRPQFAFLPRLEEHTWSFVWIVVGGRIGPPFFSFLLTNAIFGLRFHPGRRFSQLVSLFLHLLKPPGKFFWGCPFSGSRLVFLAPPLFFRLNFAPACGCCFWLFCVWDGKPRPPPIFLYPPMVNFHVSSFSLPFSSSLSNNTPPRSVFFRSETSMAFLASLFSLCPPCEAPATWQPGYWKIFFFRPPSSTPPFSPEDPKRRFYFLMAVISLCLARSWRGTPKSRIFPPIPFQFLW